MSGLSNSNEWIAEKSHTRTHIRTCARVDTYNQGLWIF